MDEMIEQLAEAAIDAVAKNASKAKDALTTESVKRRIDEKKAISDANIATTQTATQMLTDKMKEIGVPDEYAKKALINELERIVNKQSILDKIWEKTKRIFQGTPQDDTILDEEIGDISDDWLNQFRESACQKSSEEAQELFSKVLAGEIRKPGSFSLLALTTLADMDQKVAELFNTFCSLCLVRLVDPDAFLSNNSFKIDDVRLPILKDNIIDAETINPPDNLKTSEFANASKSLYDNYNLNLNSFQLLLDHRLIVDNTSTKYNHIWYNNELWGFSPNSNQTTFLIPDDPNITISGFALTSVGKELFHILNEQTPSEYWKRIFHFIQTYYNVELINLSKRP